MHLNKRGKEWLAKLLATHISRLGIDKARVSQKIVLKCKDDLMTDQHPEINTTTISQPAQII